MVSFSIISLHVWIFLGIVSFILIIHELVKIRNNYEKDAVRKIFMTGYGKFIGNKGFILPPSRGFYDENKNLVVELSDYFCGNDGVANTFIPCRITDGQTHLDIEPEKIEADFQIVYVGGECVVLNNPSFGDTVLMKGIQIIEPSVGRTVRLRLDFKKNSLNGWTFWWTVVI